MATSIIRASFPCNVERLWAIVTSLDQYAWRKDLSKIEIVVEGKQFVEYTTDGYATKFTITNFVPHERYEFDMENENMTGHWMGIFYQEQGETCIEFTEHVTAKKWFMKPFVGMYLKKQQAVYISHLRKALESCI